MAADPASLSKLRDPVLPDPVPWWPLAPGWWVLIALAVVWAGLLVAQAIARHRRNAYRRAGQRELARLAGKAAAAGEISELLKRVALAAYPRRDVASLSGSGWLAFLDRTGRTEAFTTGPGRILATATSEPEPLADPDRTAIVELCARWIRTHRPPETDR